MTSLIGCVQTDQFGREIFWANLQIKKTQDVLVKINDRKLFWNVIQSLGADLNVNKHDLGSFRKD